MEEVRRGLVKYDDPGATIRTPEEVAPQKPSS